MESSLTPSSIIKVAKKQVSCELASEAVILNLESGTYYGLDEVGARIWELAQQARSLLEIRDILLEEYSVEPDCCELDLLAFVRGMIDAGLIEIEHEKDR